MAAFQRLPKGGWGYAKQLVERFNEFDRFKQDVFGHSIRGILKFFLSES
jgi:hypothetical protein